LYISFWFFGHNNATRDPNQDCDKQKWDQIGIGIEIGFESFRVRSKQQIAHGRM